MSTTSLVPVIHAVLSEVKYAAMDTYVRYRTYNHTADVYK
jgi:hypothetical protein